MKIGKRASAKKYESLREKQAKANALVLESRKRLGATHKEVQKITKMRRLFFEKRGVKSSGRLSFKNLQAKDIDAYKNFLDAIINAHENNTYLNPVKYNNMRAKLETAFNKQYKDKGINITPDQLVDIVESDVVAQLKELGIAYKEVFESFRDYPDMKTEDVLDALNKFMDAYGEGSTTGDDFLLYIDDYLAIRNSEYGDDIDYLLPIYQSIPNESRDLETFTKLYNDYMDGEYPEDANILGFDDYVDWYVERYL